MARRSRNLAPALCGALVLSFGVSNSALAVTQAAPSSAHVAAKADSAKSRSAVKPVATSAKTSAATPAVKTNVPATASKTNVPAATASKTSAPAAASKTNAPAAAMAKPKLAPPSRLATMPTAAPTRATGMPHPESVRAALVRKPAPVKVAPANVAQSGPANTNAGPRGAVTLSPAKPNGPVPMGIPAGNAKLASGSNTGKSSDARAVAAAASGIPVAVAAKGLVAPVPKGVQVSKMTLVEPGKAGASAKGQGSVTPLPKNAPTPTAMVGKSTVVPTPPALEDQVAYQYNALGRRDPFNSLLEGTFVGDDEGGDAPPDLGGLKVVGIMWGSSDQFAMVEDIKGNSYVLRRGDKVMNGFVEGLKPDAMIVNITVDGQSQSVTVPITRKGDKNANR